MNIIFVCTGNTCRSPMAEYYLKSKNIKNLSVISRGFSSGEKANPNSVEVMSEVGIDITDHTSKCITESELAWADVVICMTESHKQILRNADQKKLCVLGSGIPDPFGCNTDTYRLCRDSIFSSIDALANKGFFNEIQICAATPDDIVHIANIEQLSFSTPWSENAIRESMEAGTSFYVARAGDNIAGYMGLSKIVGEGYVTNIAVLPEFRRRGIGKKILQYVIENSKKELEFISLEVRASNMPAISLYESFGFENVGLRKRFYSHPTEDAIIMTKNFI